jgi:hypothetical protein
LLLISFANTVFVARKEQSLELRPHKRYLFIAQNDDRRGETSSPKAAIIIADLHLNAVLKEDNEGILCDGWH